MIGVDQSYADTGVSICIDGKIVLVKDCKSKQKESNTVKRARLAKFFQKCFASCNEKSRKLEDCEVICIIERIRLQSSKPGTKNFINKDYIKGMGALDCLIIDIASQYNIPAYSVDTRSWKSQVVGTSRPRDNRAFVPPEKYPTVEYCIGLGYKEQIIDILPSDTRKKNYLTDKQGRKYIFNDNKADSIGIALYGFLPPTNQKLEEEH